MLKEKIEKINKVTSDFILKHYTSGVLSVPLSGGADSTYLALTVSKLNIPFKCYSFRMADFDSPDSKQARKTCSVLGFDYEEVLVPIDNIKADFKRLAEEHHCRYKTEYENLFPFLYLLPAVKRNGSTQVLQGIGAGNLFGDTKNLAIPGRRSQEEFNVARMHGFTHQSKSNIVCDKYAETLGLEWLSPSYDPSIYTEFLDLSLEDMHKPVQKYVYKAFFEEEFKAIGMWKARHANLQKVLKVTDYFAPLLEDSEINYRGFNKGSVNMQVKSMCEAYGRLVENNKNGLFKCP